MALERLGIEAVAVGVPGFVRDLGKMDSAIGRVGSSAVKLGKGFVGVGEQVLKFGAIAGTALVGAAGAAAGAITKLAVDAAPLQGVADAFNGIAEAAGVGGAEMLAALRDASAGMTTNRDLMLSFNKAASLVGEDFAVRLPDAMGYLGKIALSTGQDMGFMMDSLVTGVGRLSPMILDNLGIQVALSEATEKAAEMFGKQTSELTKAEQQAGMMEVIMEKLAVTTAAMPDVTGTAVQQFQSLGVMMRNLKDDIGLALLPAFQRLMSGLQPVIQQVVPRLVELFERYVVPVVEKVAGFIVMLAQTIADAGIRSIEFRETITGFLPQEVQERVLSFIETVRGIWDKAFGFIMEHKDEFIDGIKTMGKVFAAAGIVAAILKIGKTIGKIATPFGLIMTLVMALKRAWDTNFLGIRDTLTKFWEDTGRPIFEKVVAFFQDFIPRAVTFFTGLFRGEVSPALGEVGGAFAPIIEAAQNLIAAFVGTGSAAGEEVNKIVGFFRETLVPTISTVVENVAAFLNNLAQFWEENGERIIAAVGFMVRFVGGIIQGLVTTVTGIWRAFTALLSGNTEDFKQAIIGIFESLVNIALSIVGTNLDEFIATWEGIWNSAKTIVESIWEGIKSAVQGAIDAVVDGVINPIKDAWADVKGFLGLGSESKLFMEAGEGMMEGMVAGFNKLAQTLQVAMSSVITQTIQQLQAVIPKMIDTITAASALFERSGEQMMNNFMQGFARIAQALQQVITTSVTAAFQQVQAVIPTMVQQVAVQAQTAAAAATQTTNNFNLSIATAAPQEQIIADFQMLAALAETI